MLVCIMDIKKTPVSHPHFRSHRAQLTRLPLGFAITLIISYSVPLYAQQSGCNAPAPTYLDLTTLPKPTDPTYATIAERLLQELGLPKSGDSIFIVASKKTNFMITHAYDFWFSSKHHYFICINEHACAHLTSAEREFLIAHELMHIKLGHLIAREQNVSSQTLHAHEYEADTTAAQLLKTSAGGIAFFDKYVVPEETTHPAFDKRSKQLQELAL
ncbi:MAG: M48 family metalloprotease [Candidatus Babeliales bacterium]